MKLSDQELQDRIKSWEDEHPRSVFARGFLEDMRHHAVGSAVDALGIAASLAIAYGALWACFGR